MGYLRQTSAHDKLQKFQNHAARIVAGLSYEINSADALGWETLESRRQRVKSVFLYKILNDYTPPNLKQSLIGDRQMPASYNLRSTETGIALPKPRRKFLKKVSNTSELNFGIALLGKQKNPSQFLLLNKFFSGST